MLVGVDAAVLVGALVDAAAVTSGLELPPHADRSAMATGIPTSAPKRAVKTMVSSLGPEKPQG